MVPESCVIMPVDLFEAAIKGKNDVLIRRLGLQPVEQIEIQVTIGAPYPTSQQMEAGQHALEDELGSVTHFGDTLLHLLVTKMHNELALIVFNRERSLMKARNKNSETPLHCAAKVGNVDFISALSQCAPDVVKDVVREMDNNEDTALHVAAKHGNKDVAHELMMLELRLAYMFNKEGFSPLYIATVGGYTSVVVTMLEDAPSLACEQYSNGMFPVHVASQVGNMELVEHFMEEYPDDAQLLNHCGQNLFHIAAEKNEVKLFKELHLALQKKRPRSGSKHPFTYIGYLPPDARKSQIEMVASLINARDYDGNTPLHIATIKMHLYVTIAIAELLTSDVFENTYIRTCLAQEVENKQGLTSFKLLMNDLEKNASKDMQRRLKSYEADNGHRFTKDLFSRVIQPDKNKWERIQVIGLGSVLITTVTFAAAFTIPGGYDQNNGTPILGRKYIFSAFILANLQSFILAFTSILTLVSAALVDPEAEDLHYATYTFISAAGCMVLAFGLGSYVMLAPINLPIAIIVLVSTLQLGSPFVYNTIESARFIFGFFLKIGGIESTVGFGLNKWLVFTRMVITLLSIFLLALAKLGK